MANEYFGKVSKKGIQIIPDVITDSAVGSLNTLTGSILSSSGVKGITKNMLVKKVHILLSMNGMSNGDVLLVGLAANDSGIAGGMGASGLPALIDPEATEAYLTEQELVHTIWHETTSIFNGDLSNPETRVDKWVSIGGGKGIPVMAGAGPELFVFNPTGDTITAGTVNGQVTYYGVWLED